MAPAGARPSRVGRGGRAPGPVGPRPAPRVGRPPRGTPPRPVPGAGLEPASSYERRILSARTLPVCLPGLVAGMLVPLGAGPPGAVRGVGRGGARVAGREAVRSRAASGELRAASRGTPTMAGVPPLDQQAGVAPLPAVRTQPPSAPSPVDNSRIDTEISQPHLGKARLLPTRTERQAAAARTEVQSPRRCPADGLPPPSSATIALLRCRVP